MRDAPTLELPPQTSPLGVWLGTFELAGYAYGQAPDPRRAFFYPAEVVPLTLYWRAVEAPAHDYSVSLRLFDQGGGQVFQVDSQHPVLGTYPTSRWAAGEVVSDYYEIQLPPRMPTGIYRWGAILYRALPEGGWESLKVDNPDVSGPDAEVAMGGTIEVRVSLDLTSHLFRDKLFDQES